MNSLFYSYDNKIESAYIITLKGNDISEKYSKKCQMSCKALDMPYKIWEAFDGLQETIVVPEHSKNDSC